VQSKRSDRAITTGQPTYAMEILGDTSISITGTWRASCSEDTGAKLAGIIERQSIPIRTIPRRTKSIFATLLCGRMRNKAAEQKTPAKKMLGLAADPGVGR